MDAPDLAPDEKILREFERIIIAGVRHQVTLTSLRLVIREAESGKVRRDCEYSRIVLAVLSQNSLREPEISLSFAAAGGEVETDDLVFVHLSAGQNIQAADRCMDILRDHNVPMRADVRASSMKPPSRLDGSSPSLPGGTITPGRPAVPDMTRIGTTYVQQPQKEAAGGIPPAILAGVAVVVVIAIIAALVFVLPGGGTPGKGSSAPEGSAPAVITPIPVTELATQVPVTTDTPAMENLPPSVATSIPDNGIWLLVACKGPYVGTIKAGSWHLPINSSGTQLYQLPVQDTLLEGSIEKTEGFGDVMEVTITNGGRPIWRGATTKPFGMVEIRVETGAAITSNPKFGPEPVPPPPLPTPDPSLELKKVPPNGTYLRVSYTGNFTGTLAGNRVERGVGGTGDQFFQVPVSGKSIDAEVIKDDGSDLDMVVQLYKDSALILTRNTTRPFGVVEIHTSA